MWLFKRNKIDEITNVEEIEKKYKNSEEKLELEKGDKAAIFLAALLVFGPLLIIFIGAVFIISYLTIH